jgi:arylsulfatase A-like enzyme/Flp pilus assembly protein TadD
VARKKKRQQRSPPLRTPSAEPEPAAAPGKAPEPGSTRALTARLAAVATVGGALLLFRPAPPPEVRREAGLDVLLITIDTLRADALGSYGREAAGTPWLDRLASRGVRFERARAHSVVTLPSHATILSGRLPTQHGVRDNAGFRFPEEPETLATRLRDQGYRTGAFISAFPLDSRFGLDRGFDVYEDSFVDVDRGGAFVFQERVGSGTVALARAWLDEASDRPTFCWVHLYDPHFPYAPPEPFASRHASEYQGEVAAADAALAPLLEPLLDAGEEARALVVVAADHGEALGDHGESSHGIFAYESTLRVPLLLYAPRLLEPRVVESPARLADVFPTVLDALGLAPAEPVAGRSLLELAATGEDPEGDVATYFEALTGALFRGWAPLHGVVQGSYKLVDLPIPELYDLGRDPLEQRNLVESEPERARALRQLLGELRAGERRAEAGREDAETLARLRALGYVAGAPVPAGEGGFGPEDDPKRLMQLDAMLDRSAGLERRGDLAGAIELCEELIRRRPSMAASWLRLGYLRREAGDLPGAIGAMQRALALTPQDTTALSLTGVYLNEAGRTRETVELLGPLADTTEDVEVLVALGAAQAQEGQIQRSLATFARALRLDPSNPTTLVNVGTVHLMAGDLTQATRTFREALSRKPDLARAENSLGVIAARQGRPADAVAHWKRAVELNPLEFDTLFNLGSLLRDQGRAGEARPFLLRFADEAPPALYAADIRKVRRWLSEAP